MRMWLVVFVLAAVTYSVTPCCFPDEFSLDFEIRLFTNYTNGLNSTFTVIGNATVDIQSQQFHAAIGVPVGNQVRYIDYYMDLRKTPGAVAIKDRKCMEGDVYGKIGKEWRCVLNNKNVFTKNGKIYDINVLDFVFGTVEVSKDTCLPESVQVEVVPPNAGNLDVVEITFNGYNIAEKVHDRSDLDKPCEAPADQRWPPRINVTLATPDQLLEELEKVVEKERQRERERNQATTPPPPDTTWMPEYFTTGQMESEEVIDEVVQQENEVSASSEQSEEDKSELGVQQNPM